MDGAYSKITEDKARKVDNLIKERTKHERLNDYYEKLDNNKFSTKLNSIFNKTSSSDNHSVFKNSGGIHLVD